MEEQSHHSNRPPPVNYTFSTKTKDAAPHRRPTSAQGRLISSRYCSTPGRKAKRAPFINWPAVEYASNWNKTDGRRGEERERDDDEERNEATRSAY